MSYTFVSNVCCGSTLERYANKTCYNPFMGSLIADSYDFVKLCKNFSCYLSMPPEIISPDDVDTDKLWFKQTGQRRWGDRPYVIMRLGNVEIHWIHEEDPEYLLSKFNRRVAIFNESNRIPVFMWSYEHIFLDLSEEDYTKLLLEFISIPDSVKFLSLDNSHGIDFDKHPSVLTMYPYPDEYLNDKRRGKHNELLYTSSVPKSIADATFRELFHKII